MTPLGRAMPLAAVGLWYSFIATGLALAVLGATEPPVWDALSYVQKGFTFWQAVAAGKLFDPFALPMTLRPPGTILMSYPFGWSDDFRWFYFRSCIIPITLLMLSVYIAGWSRGLARSGHWALAGLALSLAGMPILYQFQKNDQLSAAVYWGLVDGFLAGVCALAMAAAVRGIAKRSAGWSATAALAAGLSFWIKPAGLALMALVGLTWIILLGVSLGWRLATLRHDAALRRFVIVSLAAALAIFATVIGLAFHSDYFSSENIAFGRRALAILEADYVSTYTAEFVDSLILTSFGYVVLMVALVGLLVAARSRSSRGAAAAATLCILVGMWLWLAETEPGQVRYFLPFGVMAFVLIVPPLLTWLQSLEPAVVFAGVGMAIAPTLVTTTLVLAPAPADGWQRMMGINLHVSDFRVENQQALDLINQLQAEGKTGATVYLTNTSSVLRNLEAVWDNSRVTNTAAPQVVALVPTDWQRASTVRVEDLLRCDMIATEFVRDESARSAILAQRQIPDFASLARLFSAWLSGLNEADGISVISDTRARLVRIVDRTQFEAALARLEAEYDLPQAYRDANPQRWWSAEEFAARKPSPVANVSFHAITDTVTLLSLRAAEVEPAGEGLRASLWLEPSAASTLGPRWFLFAHLVDSTGNIVANAQIDLVQNPGPSPERTIRHYSLYYPNRPAKAVALAFGFFKPGQPETVFLMADQGSRDWDGRRLILPLPASR